MTGSSDFPAAVDALVTALDAVVASDVRVASAPVSKENPDLAIVFIRCNSESEWALLGNETQDDRYTIEGVIQTRVKGTSETEIKSARDAAKTLLNHVASVVGHNKPDIASVMYSGLANVTWEQGATEDHRLCLISFDINVRARNT